MVTTAAGTGGDDGGYTGDVAVGGEPDVRELTHLTITKVAVDPQMHNNCYLLRCRETGDQVLVDAAAEPATLLPMVARGLKTVVTTHQHWDHHRALAEVVGATQAAVVAGEPDADAITEQTGVEVTRRVTAGDTIAVGSTSLEVIPVAGHTPGSIVLLYDDPDGHPHLFTGDCLFPGGVGGTFGDDKEALFRQLLDEVETKVFERLPDTTWFYPGHGGDSTLGAERPHVPEWRERGW
ncbi:MBL fold metallo-hydrolase [Nocardioides litoris]|uniref:MBL fold metallo-hydrolase n=1 Tax=Nocardioides litoris TaxID=1926648 RepID=UPI001FE9792B|nr:MBL fold metallo-hydrolase [Nocardioides litoris]